MDNSLTLSLGVQILTALIKIAVVVVIYRRIRNSAAAARWYTVLLLDTIGIAVVNVISSFVHDLGAYQDLLLFNYFMLTLQAPLLLLFAIHFVGKEHWLRRIGGILLIFVPTFLIEYLWATKLIVDVSRIELGQTTNHAAAGPLLYVGQLNYFLPLIFVVVLFITNYYHTHSPLKRREIRLVTWGVVLPLLLNIFYYTVGIRVFHFPAIAIDGPAGAVGNILIAYALVRYGFYIFNPSDAANNLIQVVPGSLLILDHTYTVQFANPGTRALLGYQPEQLIGSTMGKLFKDSPGFEAFERTAIEPFVQGANQLEIQELSLLDQPGKPVPVNLNATASRDGRGALVNIFFVFTSIAQLKEAQTRLTQEKASVEHKVRLRTKELAEAQAELMSSIHSMPFGYALIDAEDHILFYNDQLSHLLNRSIPTELAATKEFIRSLDTEYHESISILDNIHEVQKNGAPIERNISFGPRYFRFYFMPVLSSGAEAKRALGTVLIMEDTTEAKTQERSREEFFSIASHELRTPLTAIRGNTDMMLDYYKTALADPDLHQMVEDTRTASLRLITIVNDFLDVSRLEQGKFVFDTQIFDATDLIKQILREFDVTGSRKKLALELESDPGPMPVSADANHTRQILVNLIGNGIKYTQKGSVTIRLQQDKRVTKIAIIDTGQGIPEKSQHLLFHKFQQAADNILTRDNTQSTGLGLYIAKLLAEGMGGKVYLQDSTPGKGSTFVIELPTS